MKRVLCLGFVTKALLRSVRGSRAETHIFSRVRTVMENLEKSWNFKIVISRPGEVMEKT